MSSISDDRHRSNVVDLNSRRDAAPGDRHDDEPVFDGDVLAAQRTKKPQAEHGPVAALKEVLDHFSERDDMPSQNEVITYATTTYLRHIDPSSPPAPGEVEKHLLTIVKGVARQENAKTKEGTEKLPTLRTLTEWQIAQILHRLHVIREIIPGGMSESTGLGVLSVYQTEGRDRGTYRPGDLSGASILEELAQKYNAGLDERGFKEVKRLVRLFAERRTETLDRDLIPMDNVIINYATGERIEYSPEYVFLAKFHTALPAEKPELPRIPDEQCTGGVWDPETWTQEMHPDEGMAEYIWKVRCAMLRNRVNWRKAFLFYDPLGSTGKGTENELIRGLIGPDNCVSVPLSDFGKDFGTEPLVGAQANIVDELPVGGHYRDLSDFKATVTHDRITINRKHEKALSYKPNVGTLFNLNEHIDASDKTASLLRRFTIIPFTKRFLGAKDNPSIKEDYIQRREVREYIAYKVLVEMPKFWDMTAEEPPLVRQAMDEYRLESQSVAAWADDCLGQFQGTMVAFPQAHAHYYAWTKERNPAARPLEQRQFTFEIKQLLDFDEWIVPTVTGKDGRVTDKQLVSRTWITRPEPLLDEFPNADTVRKWQPRPEAPYKGDDAWALPKEAPRLARGFVRRAAWEAHLSGGSSAATPAGKTETVPPPVKKTLPRERDLATLRKELAELEAREGGAAPDGESMQRKLLRLEIERAEQQQSSPTTDQTDASSDEADITHHD